MDIYLLFRKKSPLTEEGLPWLRGALEHEFTARRNATGKAVVSAVLVRSLLACLDGAVSYAESTPAGEVVARVRSSSAPSAHALCAWKSSTFHIPHGEANKITYHAGVLAILDALAYPAQANDFWEAYQALQTASLRYGKTVEIQACLCRACDELYYYLRYAGLEPRPENDRLAQAAITSNAAVESGLDARSLDLAPLTDPAALQRLRGQPATTPALVPAVPVHSPESSSSSDGFVGWQLSALNDALSAGEHVLLAGPTGSGKPVALKNLSM